MQYRVHGLVIRSMDYGEGNKILTLFSKEQGKVSFVARGAKKVKSRFGSAAQLFTYGDYSYFQSGGSLGSLNHAEIVEAHHRIREDLHLAARASYLAELTDRMIADQEGQLFLFEQLKSSFEAMEEGKDPAIVGHLYEMKMLAHAGVVPELDACVSCRSDTGFAAFSVGLGGILCERCRMKDPQAYPLTAGVHKLLRLLLHTDVRRLGAINVRPETKAFVQGLIRAYYDAHVGIALKSRSFLEQMDKYGI